MPKLISLLIFSLPRMSLLRPMCDDVSSDTSLLLCYSDFTVSKVLSFPRGINFYTTPVFLYLSGAKMQSGQDPAWKHPCKMTSLSSVKVTNRICNSLLFPITLTWSLTCSNLWDVRRCAFYLWSRAAKV